MRRLSKDGACCWRLRNAGRHRLSDVSIAERWVTVDGTNIRYLEAGSGPPVIMLHGGQAYLSADIFTNVMGPIADDGFRVIAYDQPGYGLSDLPPDYTLSYRMTFVTSLMDALGIESAALVGHAQAGGMVVRLALREPDRAMAVVAACNLTLVPPLPGMPSAGTPTRRRVPSLSGPTLSDVRAELEGDVYHKDLITPELVEKKHLLSIGKNATAAVRRAHVREPFHDAVPVWERLQEIRVPLLVLFGNEDRGSVGQRARLLQSRKPALDIRVVPNAAHLLMWDAPDVFTASVLDCLAAVVSGARVGDTTGVLKGSDSPKE